MMRLKTTENASDGELVARSMAGDLIAFEELYEIHWRRVYSLCLSMLANTADAEDMTQEVFIQLYLKIGTFRGESAFTTWLHRLTVNQVLMFLRKRNMHWRVIRDRDDVKEFVQCGPEHPYPMPIIDRIALYQAISQVPPSYRAVFLLHEIEGYEHEEIAKILGCRVGTSKSQLHKARKKLRRILCNQG